MVQDWCSQGARPHYEPLLTHASTRDPSTVTSRSGSVSCGSLLVSPGSWCRQYFVCVHLQEWRLFSPVLWKSCNQIPFPLKSDFLGTPSPFVGSPGWEAWHGAQNLCNSGRDSLVSLFSSWWAAHLAGMGFGFIMILWIYYGFGFIMIIMLLSYHLFAALSLSWGYFLGGGFQCPPVDGCWTPSYNFGVLAGGDECTSFSAILNPLRLKLKWL